MLPFAAQAARGLIRDQTMRRKTMVALLIAAVLMIFAGSSLLRAILNPHEHAARFILFWLACAWLTLTALLLAVFDLLIVRAQARAARKAFRDQLAEDDE